MKPSVFILSSLFGTLAHGGRKDHRCLSDGEADSLFKAYVAAFDGITDGGAAVNKSFAEDFTLYSESNWWVSPHGNGFTDIHKEADPSNNYPPFAASRYQLIVQNSGRGGFNPNLIVTGPVMKSCDGFVFYWQGDFNFNKTFGRVNGIDMVFVDTGTCPIQKAYSEWNTLNLIYGSGGHVTFNPDLHACCDCAPGDTLCTCP